MDPEAPRALGDLEDAEPERRTPAPKKSLEQFLEEFETRLRDHPGQAATSATAALEGRAEGAWRTPVEGAERQGRRLPRPALPRPAPPPPPTIVTAPAEIPAPEPAVAVPTTDVAAPEVAPEAPGATPQVPAAKRRNRHRRHHRHR